MLLYDRFAKTPETLKGCPLFTFYISLYAYMVTGYMSQL